MRNGLVALENAVLEVETVIYRSTKHSSALAWGVITVTMAGRAAVLVTMKVAFGVRPGVEIKGMSKEVKMDVDVGSRLWT